MEIPHPNSKPLSLKVLLDSATHKPRLSKREKRRKLLALRGSEAVSGSGSVGNFEENKGDEDKREVGQANGDVPTKVFVGGIPYYSTKDDIRSYFESCGTITKVDCLRFPDCGKFRGIAIISFKTEAAAKRALALDGAEMGELFLKIQPYKATRANKVSDFAPQIVEGYNRIYVGNLSWDITEDDLKKLFSDCKISSIHFGMDKETGEFRGYAHVNFSDSLSLTLALKLDQKVVCGRPVKISCAAVPQKRVGTPSKSAPTTLNTLSISVAPTTGANLIPVATTTDTGADNTELSTVSRKIKRRTCYRCGEKGHLLSACPISATMFSSMHSISIATTTSTDSIPVATTRSTNSIPVAATTRTNSIPVAATTRTNSIPVATTTSAGADNGGLSAVSGKIKRRTCYWCGEKGHLSSACPITATTFSGTEADNGGLSAISRKIKRRTCYRCGEKGHLLSACPISAMFSRADNGGLSAISGKIKRRMCYASGEKGHISSVFPKEQSADNNASMCTVLRFPVNYMLEKHIILLIKLSFVRID
ncbi:uncharacterized protein Pyn_37660 [Prunus yedoensis var. nudiflora]|uniref:Protein gar2 n=1 Tax=Prunus yedoensis var. nudiflora TaxID=2094558 RepID=A0A315AW46_PRUYE|nr:uncharacterized protein Pyn_37660 [Prunus yedoensis var. nudiflora]